MPKTSPVKQLELKPTTAPGEPHLSSYEQLKSSSKLHESVNTATNSAEAIDQLALVFAAYNETTERMNISHQQLKAEVARLRSELAQKNEQLERKSRMAALGEMATGMAHEIRNPLGGIQLYASLLERDLENQEEKLKWACKISKGVQSLDMIVSDILAFTNEQTCEKHPVNLLCLLNDVKDYVFPQLKENEIKLDLSGIDTSLSIDVDVNMMRRVFFNLILNAIDAVDDHGVIRICADSATNEPPYRTRIRVSDTGQGISPEVINKVFNPFFTTKGTGTGLGLAIVHRLIECQGGMITASNSEFGGAEFTLLLT